MQNITLKLSGLDCASCAVNLDLVLEDLPSVKAKTNYAKSETAISFNPAQTSLQKIKDVISSQGYSKKQ